MVRRSRRRSSRSPRPASGRCRRRRRCSGPSARARHGTAVSEEVPAPARPKRRRWPLIAALAVVLAGGATTAIVVGTRGGDDAAAPAGPKLVTYPDTAEGFDRFAHELVATIQNGRHDEF